MTTKHALAPGLLSIDLAARRLGVSANTLRTWLRGGRLPFVRLGRRVLLDPKALDRFVQTNTVGNGPDEPESVSS